jgi:hypothetical protein
MNTKIRNLEDNIIALLNAENDVPLECKRLILCDILRITTTASDKAIMQEMESDNAESLQ